MIHQIQLLLPPALSKRAQQLDRALRIMTERLLHDEPASALFVVELLEVLRGASEG